MSWMHDIEDTGFNSIAHTCLIFIIGFVCLHVFVDQITRTRASKKCKEAAKYDVAFLNRNRRIHDFPPPYPNTWYFVMRSNELGFNEVKPIQMLGREFVAFRTTSGELSILDAFCPHLGAHLAHGGKVNKKGNLVCPFHHWEFNTKGQCSSVPYSTKDASEYRGIHQKKYHTCEAWGLVFLWFHADDEPPRFKIKLHSIDDNARTQSPDNMVREGEPIFYSMHMMEPSLNIQDWYHFKTMHAKFPGFKFISTNHKIHSVEFKDDGTYNFIEDYEVSFFGLAPVRANGLYNKGTFLGPAITVVLSQYGSRTVMSVAGITPIEPFKTRITYTTFASTGYFWGLGAKLVGKIAEITTHQDRQVWDHKTNPNPNRLISGDGPGFLRYRKWMEQFYSESSESQKHGISFSW